MSNPQPENPDIRLVEENGETTLYIDGGQAMQAWEHDLMVDCANVLCQYGSNFMEAGLGLGISALAIARHPNTRRHRVVEKYSEVIDLFHRDNQNVPPALEIVHADFFDYIGTVEEESLDGIFFDPYLPVDMNNDVAFWNWAVPRMIRPLRKGGVLVPCFTHLQTLRWQFEPFFERFILEKRSFRTYENTEYMVQTSGTAYLQCYQRT